MPSNGSGIYGGLGCHAVAGKIYPIGGGFLFLNFIFIFDTFKPPIIERLLFVNQVWK